MVHRRTLAAAALASAGAAAAEPIRMLSGGALEPAVASALALWRREGGGEVAVTFATAPRIADLLAAGERPDLLLAPAAVLDGLERAGRLATAPVTLGAVGVGVAVREDAASPDIGDPDALRASVLAADALVYNRASTGLYVEGLLARMGLAEILAGRTVRFPDGDAVLRRIAAGQGPEIAFAAITEILLFAGRGVRLVGPLPAGVQNRTTYRAGLLAGAGAEARRLLDFLDAAPARSAMAAAGVD